MTIRLTHNQSRHIDELGFDALYIDITFIEYIPAKLEILIS